MICIAVVVVANKTVNHLQDIQAPPTKRKKMKNRGEGRVKRLSWLKGVKKNGVKDRSRCQAVARLRQWGHIGFFVQREMTSLKCFQNTFFIF